MNKKDIKVYLQYPWFFPDSPYYKYLIDNPPKRVLYKNTPNQKGVITNKKKFLFSNNLKKGIRKTINFFNLSIPNSHLTPKGDYNLIHCAHCLSRNNDKPWVMDIEMEWQLYIGNKNKFSKEGVKKYLLNENCKKILPWTKATADEIIKEFPEIKNKIEVIYPAVQKKKVKKGVKKNISLIFSSRYFYEKGGLYALKTIDFLTKKYSQVYGRINSEVPEYLLKEYSKNKKIEFYKLIPQKRLFELYNQSDILIYPGYSDSFGFGFLEGMSFGLPIVTLEGHAREEIIGKSLGFIIKKPKNFKFEEDIKKIRKEILEELIKKTELLIENKNLLKRMSENCLKEIENGKFSIKERNKKLRKIYEEAIR